MHNYYRIDEFIKVCDGFIGIKITGRLILDLTKFRAFIKTSIIC